MPLKNRKIIITGGPTREWLDPVRFISNSSSGKMGIAIADEASKRAREVVLIHGPIEKALIKDKDYRLVSIESTVDLLDAVLNEITPNSVLVMAAAPADYTPMEKSEIKIKKDLDDDGLVLRLKKNPDILRHVARTRVDDSSLPDMFVVGFAAETNNIEEYALKKLKEKKLDMICLNDVSRSDAGFATDTNAIIIFTKNEEKIELPLLLKEEAAGRILDHVEKELQKK